jgi:hypothetical protein
MPTDFRIVPFLLLIGIFTGCTTGTSPMPRESVLFQPAGGLEPEVLKTLSENQEALLESCQQTESCDEVHFTRGLLGLFTDRELAAASFRRTLESSPNGPFAVSSTRWLELLSGPAGVSGSDPTDSVMRGATEGLVRTWLRQKYLACKSAIAETPASSSQPQPSLVALKRRIAEREKRVADLTAQLEALKTIELTKGGKKIPSLKQPQ